MDHLPAPTSQHTPLESPRNPPATPAPAHPARAAPALLPHDAFSAPVLDLTSLPPAIRSLMPSEDPAACLVERSFAPVDLRRTEELTGWAAWETGLTITFAIRLPPGAPPAARGTRFSAPLPRHVRVAPRRGAPTSARPSPPARPHFDPTLTPRDVLPEPLARLLPPGESARIWRSTLHREVTEVIEALGGDERRLVVLRASRTAPRPDGLAAAPWRATLIDGPAAASPWPAATASAVPPAPRRPELPR